MTTVQPADPSDQQRTARYLRVLQQAHAALLWKLDGLTERQLRTPLTPTGTSLLGLLKHCASVESEYLGSVFDRPLPDPPGWLAEEQDDRDTWAAADESPEFLVSFAHRVHAHGEQTLRELPLDTPGTVPWWGDHGAVTLEQVAVHLLLELHRHLGHADILRELVDGAAGLRDGMSNLPDRDVQQWAEHVGRLRSIADAAPTTPVRTGRLGS